MPTQFRPLRSALILNILRSSHVPAASHQHILIDFIVFGKGRASQPFFAVGMPHKQEW